MILIERIGDRDAYLDANLFIYAVEGILPYVETVGPLFRAVAEGHIRAVTSELTLAETLVVPVREGNVLRQHAYRQALRTHGGLTVLPVSRAVLIEAAQLRAVSPVLKLPDALHAATARQTGCEVFLTNDGRIKTLPGLEVLQLSDAAT